MDVSYADPVVDRLATDLVLADLAKHFLDEQRLSLAAARVPLVETRTVSSAVQANA